MPLMTSYQPELDVSEELGLKDAAYYQSLISIVRWSVELVWIDICLEVSMMSSLIEFPPITLINYTQLTIHTQSMGFPTLLHAGY